MQKGAIFRSFFEIKHGIGTSWPRFICFISLIYCGFSAKKYLVNFGEK